MNDVPRVHIIGRKNHGKTMLVEDLVRHFSAQGVRVGTIKHTHHRHELDVPGKDSYRHREAGAAVSAILSPTMAAVFSPCAEGDGQDRYDLVAPLMADCRLVLVEGHAAADGFKLEVWRAAAGTRPIAADDPTVHAVISNDAPDVDVPVWPRGDVAALAAKILLLLG